MGEVVVRGSACVAGAAGEVTGGLELGELQELAMGGLGLG